jgi:hypothetical protein
MSGSTSAPLTTRTLRVADGDTVTRISWVFEGGAFHGQSVIDTLRDYLRQVTELLEEAERKLAS